MVSIGQLLRKMPEGYEEWCYQEKAIVRKRGITSPTDLMMLSMFHLLNGCSLVEISTIANLTKLGEISDVAFMKRFENCNKWFKKITSEMVMGDSIIYEKPSWLNEYRVIAVDASDVTEKGRSGRLYRLHYALELFNMESVQYKITTQETGETLRNFSINAGDLIIADRGYSSYNGIEHCLNGGGDFVFRLKKTCFKMSDADGQRVNLLDKLRLLGENEALNSHVYIKDSTGKSIGLRVCAIRKTPDNIVKSRKKLRRRETTRQTVFGDDTKEFNDYIVLITSLQDEIGANPVLELYRLRWQVEIYFKRLKSIMDFGELPKRRPESVMAWLNGKMMIALLIERILSQSIFPPEGECQTEYLA
jgi:hypothetical protein